jgi:hypothetical protein
VQNEQWTEGNSFLLTSLLFSARDHRAMMGGFIGRRRKRRRVYFQRPTTEQASGFYNAVRADYAEDTVIWALRKSCDLYQRRVKPSFLWTMLAKALDGIEKERSQKHADLVHWQPLPSYRNVIRLVMREVIFDPSTSSFKIVLRVPPPTGDDPNIGLRLAA